MDLGLGVLLRPPRTLCRALGAGPSLVGPQPPAPFAPLLAQSTRSRPRCGGEPDPVNLVRASLRLQGSLRGAARLGRLSLEKRREPSRWLLMGSPPPPAPAVRAAACHGGSDRGRMCLGGPPPPPSRAPSLQTQLLSLPEGVLPSGPCPGLRVRAQCWLPQRPVPCGSLIAAARGFPRRPGSRVEAHVGSASFLQSGRRGLGPGAPGGFGDVALT